MRDSLSRPRKPLTRSGETYPSGKSSTTVAVLVDTNVLI